MHQFAKEKGIAFEQGPLQRVFDFLLPCEQKPGDRITTHSVNKRIKHIKEEVINTKLKPQLQEVYQTIMNIKEENMSENKLAALNKLKSEAKNIYDQTIGSNGPRELNSALSRLKTALEGFNKLKRYAQLFDFSQQYKGKNQKRLKSISQINTLMSQAFKEYADGNNSDQIFSTFKINLNIERQAIQTDHKQYGAT